jgi:hypothetical protein
MDNLLPTITGKTITTRGDLTFEELKESFKLLQEVFDAPVVTGADLIEQEMRTCGHLGKSRFCIPLDKDTQELHSKIYENLSINLSLGWKKEDKPVMKTLIIYNNLTEPLQFLLVEGDYSRFNGIYVGSDDTNDTVDEFNAWRWDEYGLLRTTDWTQDTAILEAKQFDKVAIVTFLP